MMTDIKKESNAINCTSEVTSERRLPWAKCTKIQRSQKVILDSLKGNEESDMMGKVKHKTKPEQYIANQTGDSRRETCIFADIVG